MSETFQIDLNWKRTNEFRYETFNRDHTITLGGQQHIQNSAAAAYFGNAELTNPEELLAASLASCHMMTFLAVASKMGYTVDSYADRAVAILGKNEEGRIFVETINLKPVVVFSGEKLPDTDQLEALHAKAHKNCFIANSIKTKVNIL